MASRNQAILDYLKDYITRNGYAPSVRELGAAFGWTSPSTAQARLRQLVNEGSIVRVGPRAIRINDE